MNNKQLPTRRVVQVQGQWFWIEADERGLALPNAAPVGPFRTAVEAGADARNSILLATLAPEGEA